LGRWPKEGKDALEPVYFRDPEGNGLELYRDPTGALAEAP